MASLGRLHSGDWTPVEIEPIMPQGWDVVSHVPTLADAWDVIGPAIAQNMRDTMTAVRDPQTWVDAAHQYADALVAGTSGPKPSAIAARIGNYAAKMGYNVNPSGSQISKSAYLDLSHDVLPGGSLKVRVSDHNLPPSYGPPGDFDVHAGMPREESVDWAQAVRGLADRVGEPVPAAAQSQLTKLGLSRTPEQAAAVAEQYAPAIEAGKAGNVYKAPDPVGDALRAAIEAKYGNQAGTGVEGGGIRAFHGSPHSFDKFDIGKIGTGEGAQAYGHGLYFAGNEGVAQSYRDMLGTRSMDLKDPGNLAAWMYHKNMGDRANAITELKTSLKSAQNYPKSYQPGDADRFSAALDKLESNAEMPSAPGHMYEVNLNANPDHLLDWDKPLSEQSQHVQDALGQLNIRGGQTADEIKLRMMALGVPEGEAAEYGVKNAYEATGQHAYQDIGSKVDAAATLKAAGIPGIKYLDGSSRNAGEGSHNYVMFDDATVELLRKYGLAGLMAGGGAAALAQPAEAAPTPEQAIPAPMDEWQPVSREPIAVEPVSATVH